MGGEDVYLLLILNSYFLYVRKAISAEHSSIGIKHKIIRIRPIAAIYNYFVIENNI
jgi:hypothetical protein